MKVTVKNKSGIYGYPTEKSAGVLFCMDVVADLNEFDTDARAEFEDIKIGDKLELTIIEPECDHNWLLYAEYSHPRHPDIKHKIPKPYVCMNCPKCGNVLSSKEIEAIVTKFFDIST